MSKVDDELYGLKSSRTGEFLHSETADELFEKLGYKKKQKGQYIEYVKANCVAKEEYVISFMMKTIMATLYVNGYLKKPLALEMQELQAINEKCRELGWLGE